MRIGASILLMISVLFMPWWLSFVLALVFMFYFNIFFEAILIFLISDLLYGVKEIKFFGITFISLIITAIALTLIEILKRKLKFYP